MSDMEGQATPCDRCKIAFALNKDLNVESIYPLFAAD